MYQYLQEDKYRYYAISHSFYGNENIETAKLISFDAAVSLVQGDNWASLNNIYGIWNLTILEKQHFKHPGKTVLAVIAIDQNTARKLSAVPLENNPRVNMLMHQEILSIPYQILGYILPCNTFKVVTDSFYSSQFLDFLTAKRPEIKFEFNESETLQHSEKKAESLDKEYTPLKDVMLMTINFEIDENSKLDELNALIGELKNLLILPVNSPYSGNLPVLNLALTDPKKAAQNLALEGQEIPAAKAYAKKVLEEIIKCMEIMSRIKIVGSIETCFLLKKHVESIINEAIKNPKSNPNDLIVRLNALPNLPEINDTYYNSFKQLADLLSEPNKISKNLKDQEIAAAKKFIGEVIIGIAEDLKKQLGNSQIHINDDRNRFCTISQIENARLPRHGENMHIAFAQPSKNSDTYFQDNMLFIVCYANNAINNYLRNEKSEYLIGEKSADTGALRATGFKICLEQSKKWQDNLLLIYALLTEKNGEQLKKYVIAELNYNRIDSVAIMNNAPNCLQNHYGLDNSQLEVLCEQLQKAVKDEVYRDYDDSLGKYFLALVSSPAERLRNEDKENCSLQ